MQVYENGVLRDETAAETTARELAEQAVGNVPEPVPAEISPRQLLIGLADKGWITPDEALAAATAGTPPAAVEGVFKALPTEQQLPARITWARMTTVLRTDPLVPLLAAAKGQDADAVDDFFRVYSKV